MHEHLLCGSCRCFAQRPRPRDHKHKGPQDNTTPLCLWSPGRSVRKSDGSHGCCNIRSPHYSSYLIHFLFFSYSFHYFSPSFRTLKKPKLSLRPASAENQGIIPRHQQENCYLCWLYDLGDASAYPPCSYSLP